MDEHARVVSQLRQKTDELERVFTEARNLEQENMQLRDAVTSARKSLIETEHKLTIKENECITMSAALQQQQNTIDQLLQAEMARASGKPVPQNSLALPPPTRSTYAGFKSAHLQQSTAAAAGNDDGTNDDSGTGVPAVPSISQGAYLQLEKDYDEANQKIEQLQNQLTAATKAAEEFRKGAAMHNDEMHRQQNRVKSIEADANARVDAAELRAKESADKAKSLQEALTLMRDQHKQLIAEAQHLEGVDAQAREGVRAEWMALAAENERLMRVADEAESVKQRVRAEHERLVAQLVSQRHHFDSTIGVLRKELEAVHEENDRQLVNYQRVTAERDALRRELEKAETLARHQLDVDSSVVASRELRRQIAEATANQQADANRAAALERDLARARNDADQARADADRTRGELQEMQQRLQHARRDIELAKRGGGGNDSSEELSRALGEAQRKLRELQSANEAHQIDPQQTGAFLDEVDTTTGELAAMARDAASFLAPVPVSVNPAVADAGSPRRVTILQRLAELRGLLRWIHATLNEITGTRPGAAAASSQQQIEQQQPRMPSVGSTATSAPSTFHLVPSSRSALAGDTSILRGTSADDGTTGLRDLSVQRQSTWP